MPAPAPRKKLPFEKKTMSNPTKDGRYWVRETEHSDAIVWTWKNRTGIAPTQGWTNTGKPGIWVAIEKEVFKWQPAETEIPPEGF